jgi:uncharacterized protein
MTDGPRRTCIVCRRVRPKRDLVRLARRADGRVVVDRPATMPGRGAYVCNGLECTAGLAKTARVNQAFRRPCAMDGITLMSGR